MSSPLNLVGGARRSARRDCPRTLEGMSSPAIVVRGLQKFYGNKAAVDGVDLEVPRGSFFGFLGPNGAGKSTTIRMLTGLIPPDRGTIEILGFAMPRQELEIKQRIGLVPDESLLFDRLTGLEFLEFVGRMYGLERAVAIERAGKLLDLFQLQRDRKIIGEYSKGMRKRVAMAASLIHHPELFLMDEPFEGVDAMGARLMKDILVDQVTRRHHFPDEPCAGSGGAALRPHRDYRRRPDCHLGHDRRPARGRRVAGGCVRACCGRGAAGGAPGLAMIAAILRAQWLSMRLGSRRGSALSIFTAVAWYGAWTAVGIAAAFAMAHLPQSELNRWVPLGLLAVFGYWQLAPILTASMGSSLDLRKLLLFPIPHRQLFAIEVLLRLATAAEVFLVLAGGAAGLLLNPAAGGWRMAPRLAVALLVFILFNLFLSSGVRSVLERLLSRRRVREVLVLAMTLLWIVPRLLMQLGYQPAGMDKLADRMGGTGYPWAAASQVILGGAAAEGLLFLAGWTVLAWWFGRAQFERSLRYDPLAAQATAAPDRPRSSWLDRLYRLPSLLLRDPLAGLVEKELRSLARTPRFRMVFVMGFTFGTVVWLPLILGRGGRNAGGSSYFLVIVSTYALTLLGQVSYWNCLGFDRSAAAFYFAAPPPFRTVLLGKNLASLCFVYLEVAIVGAVTLVFGLGSGLPGVVEALGVMGVCALYLLGLGNLSSIHYPRGLHPERVSQGEASGRFQGLLFVLYPLALLPVGLAYLARYALDSQLAFLAMLAIAAIMGGVFYWTATQSAVATAIARREQIVQELSRSDGPVASN